MKPVICPKCNKPAPWVENKEKYGRNFGKSYMCYFCKPCGTYVGCHNNTRHPLGTMADKELMIMRIRVHAKIDPLWKTGKIERRKLYHLISDKLGFTYHTGEADLETCKKVLELSLPTQITSNIGNMKEVKGGEIVYYRGKLARIIGYSPRGEKCVIVEPITDEGRDKCPHCQKPLPTQHHINEGCLNWQNDIKPVETL